MSDNPSATVADKIEAINAELKRNPPAFPMTGEGCHDARYSQPGMTLRDWFAGQALAECISLAVEWPTALGGSPMPLAARLAYEAADEMLAARTGDA